MEKIIVLGTGAGLTENCYNTCFILERQKEYLLVDTGAGMGIMTQLRQANMSINQIHHIFISHKHIDHLLGIFCCLRLICQNIGKGKYQGKLKIYCSAEIKEIILDFVQKTFHQSHFEQIKQGVEFILLEDEKQIGIIGYKMRILNLYSKECEQYGFQTKLDNGKIFTFLGDVPCSPKVAPKIEKTDWVCHEVFCQENEKDKFNPHKINHSTTKDVCEMMEQLQVKNLIIWHTKDNQIKQRKTLYTQEGKQYFKGNLYVPDDLERIEL